MSVMDSRSHSLLVGVLEEREDIFLMMILKTYFFEFFSRFLIRIQMMNRMIPNLRMKKKNWNSILMKVNQLVFCSFELP